MDNPKLKLSQELKEKCGIDCTITEDGDRLLVEYTDGCASSEVMAIAHKLGLTVVVDRSFSEEKFTDFAVDFALELGISVADVRFKLDGDRYQVIIPDSDTGRRLAKIV